MKFSNAGLFLLFFCVPVLLTYGQSPLRPSYTMDLRYHYAFVMKHSRNMAHLANQRPHAIEADFYHTTTGKRLWEQIHNYPIIGLAFQYYNMDKEKPLGDSYSLVIYYGKNFLQTKRSTFSWRIGTGPGYIERRFNKHDNYKNNLISSRLNFTLYGRLQYSFAVNDRWSLNAGLGIIHFSNGATKVPNLGINIPGVHFGLGYILQENTRLRDSIPVFKKETQFHFSLSGGLKQTYPIEGPGYGIASFSGYVNRKLNYKSALNIGTDMMYDASNKKIIDSTGAGDMEYFKWGITFGHEFFIQKLSLLTQIGIYIYDPLKLEKPYYQRTALKYYFKKHFFGTIALKTHLGAADYVEWGVGIKL